MIYWHFRLRRVAESLRSFRVQKFSQLSISASASKSANRPGELERMSKNYDARRTVRRRCLSELMTNLLSPFEGIDGKLRGEKGWEGWKQSFQPSIPFLARLELCHVEINCFTRPRNIVTRTFESRDVGSTSLSCK